MAKTKKVYDFSGYATKANVKCSDGRVITPDAFKHQDGVKVPLVWHHLKSDLSNVLGYAMLEHRADGMYSYASFNDTPDGQKAKALVEHGDLTSLSIYANQLQHRGNLVEKGEIREMSIVMAGANPEAKIETLSIAHADGSETQVEDEAIMSFGTNLSHEDEKDDEDEKTVQDVFDTMNEEQKDVVYLMLAEAADKVEHSDEGGEAIMKKNLFEDNKGNVDERLTKMTTSLSHDQLSTILDYAEKNGTLLSQAFLAHAVTYGIEDIDVLFPDAKTLTPTPEMISRDMGWVSKVLQGATHIPFSRIKSVWADITQDEARAKGYIKGTLKKEEFFKLSKRVTTPTTIYKKQKLDRDDVIDITDLDIVSWLKMEMRMMLDEEIARAGLLGDGREADDDDKINEENIRPIYSDDNMYSHHYSMPSTTTRADQLDGIIRSRKFYKGSGSPKFFTTEDVLTDFLLLKDTTGRRLYNTEAELASALRVNEIVTVEPMEGVKRLDGTTEYELVGIIVNMKDYKYGADKGGAISMFDDFDIDYNQNKYLIETRCSGCLVKYKSAIVVELTRTVTP